MKWTLRVSFERPRTWNQMPTRRTWRGEFSQEDDVITVTDSQTFFNLTDTICRDVFSKFRGDDNGVDEHLWKLYVCDKNRAVNADCYPEGPFIAFGETHVNYGRPPQVFVSRLYHIDRWDEPCARAHETMISKKVLPLNKYLRLDYDMGTTTTVYMQVIKIEHDCSEGVSYSPGPAEYHKPEIGARLYREALEPPHSTMVALLKA